MINKAPSNLTADEISIPSPLALIAATEKISIGIIKGNIIPRTGLEEDAMAKKMMTSRAEYQQYKRYGQYVG